MHILRHVKCLLHYLLVREDLLVECFKEYEEFFNSDTQNEWGFGDYKNDIVD